MAPALNFQMKIAGRQARRSLEVPGQSRADRERGQPMRPDAAIQGAGKACTRSTPIRGWRSSGFRPMSLASRSRAPTARSPSSADELRREVRHVLEGRGQGRRPVPALQVPDLGRDRSEVRGRHQVELREVPARSPGQHRQSLCAEGDAGVVGSRARPSRPRLTARSTMRTQRQFHADDKTHRATRPWVWWSSRPGLLGGICGREFACRRLYQGPRT